MLNADLQVVRLIHVLAAPHLRKESAERQDTILVAGEMVQDAVLNGRQIHRFVVDLYFARGVVNPKRPRLEGWAFVRRGLRLGTAQHGADACEQLGVRERLSDIIVSAEFETLDLVDLLVARGEHHDRHLGGATDPLEHLKPVQIR